MFLHQNLKQKFTQQKLTDFYCYLPENILNIENKKRSNIFSWRGQFSPQLIESLLFSYCPKNAKILDPFAGSGTVLYESACLGLQSLGCEINPAAWILSKTYQLTNLQPTNRAELIKIVTEKLESQFSRPQLFDNSEFMEINIIDFQESLSCIYKNLQESEKIILDTLVILLDINNNKLTKQHIYNTFYQVSQNIKNFPYSEASIQALLCDARSLKIESNTIDFVITSPPYINVINYHQNYRYSAEILGWNLLKIAKSEIGSNRANRRNRFLTVIQYCLDMACVIQELQRVCKPNARIIFVVGYESQVLGVPFYNAEIISEIATKTNLFELVISQKRIFKNKFGKFIREDLLNFSRNSSSLSVKEIDEIARKVAYQVLSQGLTFVSDKNKSSLIEAIEKIPYLGKSPLY